MDYNILEARIEFKNSQLDRITLLVDMSSNQSKPLSDVRAIYATTKPRSGYMFLPSSATLSDELLQEVAAAGMETVDRDVIFPKWKAKYSSLTNKPI